MIRGATKRDPQKRILAKCSKGIRLNLLDPQKAHYEKGLILSKRTTLEVVPTYQVKIEIELPDEDAADAAAVKHSSFLIEVLDLSKMPHAAHVFL